MICQGTFRGGTFGGSQSYKEVSEKTKTGEAIFTSTMIECCAFVVHVNLFHLPTLSHAFTNAVEDMPKTFNKANQAWFIKFWEEFGTHVPTEIKMGSMAGELTEFSRHKYESFQSSNLDIERSAGFALNSVSAQTSVERSSGQTFESVSSKSHRFSVGGGLPTMDDIAVWVTESRKDPMPMTYVLIENVHLITKENFPRMQAEDVAAKSKALTTGLNAYCDILKAEKKLLSCNRGNLGSAPSINFFGGFYSDSVDNPYTGGKNCPIGYSVRKTDKIITYCTTGDHDNVFGGMYHTCKGNGNNPRTNSEGCPSQFFAIKVGGCGKSNGGGFLFLCQNVHINLEVASIGGGYTKRFQANPFTNVKSCPYGFTAHSTGTADQKKAAGFICLSNIY